MKRILIAVVLLVVVAVGCTAVLIMQTRTLDDLMAMAEEVERAYDDGDREACLRLSGEFADACEKRTTAFLYFIRHGDVAPLTDAAAALPVLLAFEKDDMFIYQLLNCQSLLNKLKTQETPALENII